MARFSVIGTGNMGSAIAGLLERGGAEVSRVSRDETGSAPLGDVVVLAVPYPALAEIVKAYGSQLDGKVVVDITNPLNFETFDSLVVSPEGSAAAEVQQAVPAARVLKAFNTNFAATLAGGTVGDAPTTVLVAGDDADAKQTLIDAITAGGESAVDAGSLSRARELEALGFLQLTLAVSEKIGWTAGFNLFR